MVAFIIVLLILCLIDIAITITTWYEIIQFEDEYIWFQYRELFQGDEIGTDHQIWKEEN